MSTNSPCGRELRESKNRAAEGALLRGLHAAHWEPTMGAAKTTWSCWFINTAPSSRLVEVKMAFGYGERCQVGFASHK